MRIAVLSDSHDHIPNIRAALALVREHGCGLIVHCGDFVAPFMLKELAQAGLPVHGVFGNNDGDHYLLTKTALTGLADVHLYGITGEIEVEGFKAGFTHTPQVGRGLAATGDYHAVFHGHTHVHTHAKVGGTLLLNPGEVMGKEGNPGFAVVDTATGEFVRVDLPA